MTFSWNTNLLEQIEFQWNHLFYPRAKAITDAQYLWEPVDGCWSIRTGENGRWLMDGTGDARWQKPPPFTTIAWRIAHITEVFGQRASNHFGDGSFNLATVPWDGTAATGVALMKAEYDRWRAGVRSLGEDGLFRPCGPAEGPFAEHPFLTLVLHINREFLCHQAEVQLLLDLHRETIGEGETAFNVP